MCRISDLLYDGGEGVLREALRRRAEKNFRTPFDELRAIIWRALRREIAAIRTERALQQRPQSEEVIRE